MSKVQIDIDVCFAQHDKAVTYFDTLHEKYGVSVDYLDRDLVAIHDARGIAWEVLDVLRKANGHATATLTGSPQEVLNALVNYHGGDHEAALEYYNEFALVVKS